MTAEALLQGLDMVFIGLIGAFLGSFLNVVAYRVPRNESIVFPGSHCPSCQHSLKPWELIPVVSWVLLLGRCHYCRARIPIRYPVLELLTAALFLWTALHVPSVWGRLAWWAFWLLLIAAVGTDLTSMRVPNMLTYPASVIIPLLSGIAGIQTWGMVVLGAFLCFFLLLFIHFASRGNMGLGDAKLYFSIGAILGPVMGVESLIFASAFGATVGLLLRAVGRLQAKQRIPFVPYIGAGVIVTAMFGRELIDAYLRLLGVSGG